MADEPDATLRVIVFSVSDGTFTSRANISLEISTIDDNPTLVSVDGSGMYSYTKGNPFTLLEGILLDDKDAVNSDVMVENVTIEILFGADNEILNISSTTSPTVTVSNITSYYKKQGLNYIVSHPCRHSLKDHSWYCRAQHICQTSRHCYETHHLPTAWSHPQSLLVH